MAQNVDSEGKIMQRISHPKAPPETRTFYCQVDSYQCRKDYLRGGRCVRLIGIENSDYQLLVQNEIRHGVSTFIVDFDVPSFLKRAHPKVWKLKNCCHDKELAGFELNLDEQSVWYEIILETTQAGYSYFYPTFSDLPPTYFHAKSIRRVLGPELPVESASSKNLCSFTQAVRSIKQTNRNDGKWNFSAFHVGQGMCSMAHSHSHGVMFDAGAGKPITRERFLAGLKKNELQSLVHELDSIPYFVLSHFDNDHWNMLAWDKSLRDAVDKIIVPKVDKRSARSVAFFDRVIKDKVFEASKLSIPLGRTSSIKTHRTKPSASDNNGNCLVSIIDIEGKFALVAGDYVYSRMLTDTKPLFSRWCKFLYSAVIVPHHGDEASSLDIPGCADCATAFFSAGTHKTWNHPSEASINGHSDKGFLVVEDHTQKDIIKKVLI